MILNRVLSGCNAERTLQSNTNIEGDTARIYEITERQRPLNRRCTFFKHDFGKIPRFYKFKAPPSREIIIMSGFFNNF